MDNREFDYKFNSIEERLEDVEQKLDKLIEKMTWWGAVLSTFKFITGIVMLILTLKLGDISQLFHKVYGP